MTNITAAKMYEKVKMSRHVSGRETAVQEKHQQKDANMNLNDQHRRSQNV